MIDKSRGDMIPHIVLREIRAIPVPLPLRDKQREIVAIHEGKERYDVVPINRSVLDTAIDSIPGKVSIYVELTSLCKALNEAGAT